MNSAFGRQPALVFEPIASRRAFEAVCDRIREQLRAGLLKPGDKLPTERDLALQLQVSRTAVREALRSLENAGIIMTQRGPLGGAFIQGGDGTRMTGLIQDLLTLGAVSLAELTESRIYLLNAVVQLACQRATEDDFTALKAIVERLENALDDAHYAERIRCAKEFYEVLAKASGNAILAIMADSINEIVQRQMSETLPRYPAQKLIQSRRQFLKLLSARDAEGAAASITRHLRGLHEHIRRYHQTQAAPSERDAGK